MRGSGGLVVAVLGLCALAFLRPGAQVRQEAAGLVIQGEDTQGMASDVAVPTLALGAFRGLVVDYLWLRTISLREQGRTYEARVLAEQIGRLQPRLPAVWDYLGSHLAYDLAATAKTAEGRWGWIQNGLDLVREQGLGKNPQSSRLCYTLSRIYQDKVNASMDDFHLDFKRLHMLRMRRAGVALAPIEELASAPTLSALAAQDPQARRLLERYAKARGLESWSEVEPSRLCRDHHAYVHEGRRLDPEASPEQIAEVALIRGLSQSPAGQRVLASCGAAALREIGFDPEEMRAVNAEWGSLDWQSSFSAPIYWSARGVRLAEAKDDIKMKSRCRRAALQGLKNAMRLGRSKLVLDEATGELIPLSLPNLELIPDLDRLYAEGEAEARADIARMTKMEVFDPDDFRAASSFQINQASARLDFLIEATILYSEYGKDVEGQVLHAKAGKLYPDEASFQVPYQDFLITVLTNRITDSGAMDTVDTMTQGLLGLWQQTFVYLAQGEDERARTYNTLARARLSRWNHYVRVSLEEDPAAAKRLRLNVKEIYEQALDQAKNTPELRAVGFRIQLARRLNRPLDEFLFQNERLRTRGPK